MTRICSSPPSVRNIFKEAEWLMRGSSPIALIVRFNMSKPDSKPVDSALVVSKLARKSACVVESGYGSKDQNAKARRITDTAQKSFAGDHIPC